MTRDTKHIVMPGYDTRYWFADDYPQPLFNPEKVILHSIEGASMPTYRGGADAPQVTLDPWGRQRFQHYPLNMPGRALVNPDSTPVSENRDGAVQIEIYGCSDSAWAVKIGRPDRDLRLLTDDDYDWLGREIAAICEATGIRPVLTDRAWPEYPASYGAGNGVRMTSAEYDAFRGIAGHMHVPGNLHGDVTLDPKRLQAAIDRHTTAADPDPKVLARQRELVAAGLLTPADVDGIDGPRTQAAWRRYMATLDDISSQLARLIDRVDTIPWQVWSFPLKDKDASFWVRFAAGGIKTDAEGRQVPVVVNAPPLDTMGASS